MANIKQDLRIAVVGAGIGGLTSALALAKQGFQQITVYETASNLGFVGAGIQLAPNMARILDRLGCWSDIYKEAVDLKETSIRQGDTDAELGHVDLHYVQANYGYPHMVGHRASLVGAVFEACKRESAVKLLFSTTVVDVHAFAPRPSFTVRSSATREEQTITADVLLGADGVKSKIRSRLLEHTGVDAQVLDTGQAAYRIMLRREQMVHDSELRALIDSDKVVRWIGEKRHIIAYPVSSKQIYNMSSAQPDVNFSAEPSATYTTRASKAAMLAVFADFCPKVQRLLDLVPDGEVCEWKLRVHAPLPSWVCGAVALLGDACHPMLPHLAQGAAQAIEDAAVLAVVLSRIPSAAGSDAAPEAINKSLRVYERIRKDRAEQLVDLAAASGRALHLGQGAAKAERDKQFAALKGTKHGAVPDKWADADVQKMIYGHDCMEVAAASFDGLFGSI